MPASAIIILIESIVLVALALFTMHQISVREDLIAEREVELLHARNDQRRFAGRCERLLRRYRTEYDRANDAEERTLDRNIFDELANEYAWLKFPALPEASASSYHFVEADLYDAALNSHEVK